MVCPECGASVGDTLQLCELCRAKVEAERMEAETEPQLDAVKSTSAISIELAGIVTRGVALSVDLSLFWLILLTFSVYSPSVVNAYLISTLAPPNNSSGIQGFLHYIGGAWIFALTLTFCLYLLYSTLFESNLCGASIGKYLCGLLVVDKDGKAPNLLTSFIRSLLKSISILFAGIGLLIALIDPESKSFPDRTVGTSVVKISERKALTLAIFWLIAMLNLLVSGAVFAKFKQASEASKLKESLSERMQQLKSQN